MAAAVEAVATERRRCRKAATASFGAAAEHAPARLARLVHELKAILYVGSCCNFYGRIDGHPPRVPVLLSCCTQAVRARAAAPSAPRVACGTSCTAVAVGRASVDARHACSGTARLLSPSMSRAACCARVSSRCRAKTLCSRVLLFLNLRRVAPCSDVRLRMCARWCTACTPRVVMECVTGFGCLRVRSQRSVADH